MPRVAEHKPDFVVVSLGIDTFMGDPLGDFCITREGYAAIGQIIGALHVPTMYRTRSRIKYLYIPLARVPWP
jgi:acetoin utilization deacetylase AcuC-like enzyme